MTRRAVLFRAGVSLFACAPWATGAHAADPPWLDGLMASLAKISERRAVFAEERRFGALNSPLRSAGTLYYRRPDHLEKTTLRPRPEKLVVDGNTLTVTPADGFPREISLDSQPEAAVFVDAIRAPLSGDLVQLRRSFLVVATGNLANWHLDLTPTETEVAALLRGLAISGAGPVVNTIDIVLANGDTDTMTIRDVT